MDGQNPQSFVAQDEIPRAQRPTDRQSLNEGRQKYGHIPGSNILEQSVVRLSGRFGELLLQFRDPAVLQLAGFREVAFALGLSGNAMKQCVRLIDTLYRASRAGVLSAPARL